MYSPDALETLGTYGEYSVKLTPSDRRSRDVNIDSGYVTNVYASLLKSEYQVAAYFSMKDLPSQCGILYFHSFQFGSFSNRLEMKKKWFKDVILIVFKLMGYSMIILTDNDFNPIRKAIFESAGFEGVTTTTNTRSEAEITTWTLTKPVFEELIGENFDEDDEWEYRP